MPTPSIVETREQSRIQYEGLVKGFNTLTLAAGFIASIQAQVMSTTIGRDDARQNVAIRAINAFYMGGLVLDLLSAMLAYLTARWLDRLTEKEKELLEQKFTDSKTNGGKGGERPSRSKRDLLFYAWLGLSLFVPMPLLVLGVVCMLAGLYTYVWTQHPTVVAALVTLAGGAAVPFVVGDFYIGRDPDRRASLIARLSETQGDW